MEKIKAKLKAVKQQRIDPYKPFLPALFFIAGFLYDILTLERVDSLFSIIQQLLFLLLCIFLIYLVLLNYGSAESATHRYVKKAMTFNNEALHFLIGSLLSAFTLFYIKSASSFSSFMFIFLLFGVLIYNEKAANQKRGSNLQIKWGLISFCILSFLSYFIPMVVGGLGFWITVLTALVYCGIVAAVAYGLIKLGANREKIVKKLVTPSAVVLLVVSFLNFMNWVPPIPLSIQHIGIYHNVEKQQGQFKLYHQNPWWRFWHHSDQNFIAAPGDRLYGYARIFSPVGFSDNVYFHWLQKTNGKWSTVDRIPVKILGGRDQGFRAYTFKANYQAGQWILKVETPDGREIGRSSFHVTQLNEPPEQRIYKVHWE